VPPVSIPMMYEAVDMGNVSQEAPPAARPINWISYYDFRRNRQKS